MLNAWGNEPQNEVKMTDRRRSIYLATLVATSAFVASAGLSHADSRGAPIVYGDASGRVQSAPSQPVISTAPPPSQVPVTSARTARLEFRYPGSPAPQVQSAPVSAPRAYTTPEISYAAPGAAQAPAKQYAALPDNGLNQTGLAFKAMPQVPATGAPVASKAIESASMAPIRITARVPDAAKPIGRPLTLSRVRANSEASISEEIGKAGVYTDGFDGRPTANGEIFDNNAMTGAHPSLPLPSLVQVSHQQNGREIVVRVNDRGPFGGDRVMDLSERAAEVLGFSAGQTAPIKLRYLGPAPVMQVPAAQTNAVAQLPVQEASYRPSTPVVAAPFQTSPRPALSPVSSAGQGNVYIQAGSFTDIGNAHSLTRALGRNMTVEIQEARVNDADYFRVMIGPFQSQAEANIQRSQLRAAGIADGFLVEK